MSFGKSAPTPPATTASTVTQVPEYAPEQREYVSDVFGKAQELYEQRTEEGFQPFPGAQIAPLQAQEEEAFAGIESLARGPGAAPAFEVARTASLGAAAPITAGEIQGLMNPYQQAVTDIAKREAVRQYQRGPQQQMRTAAVSQGGLRGARRFIEEAEGQRNLQQQLSDIQTLGGQQAYQQAMAEAAAARGRLANLAAQMPGIGTGAYQQQIAQLGQLGGVGEALRAREQAAIDLAQQQFQQELMFPEETLATYLRFITNAPSPSGFQRQTVTPTAPGPSALTQIGSTAAGIGTLLGGIGKSGLFNQGGAVGRRAGLSGIVRRNTGGQIVRMANGGPPPTTGFGRDLDSLKSWFDRNFVNIPGTAERDILTQERMEQSPFNQAVDYFTEPVGTAAITEANRQAIEDVVDENLYVDPNYELIDSIVPSEEKTTPAATDTIIDELSPSAPDTEPQEKQQTLAERYAEYKKLMEGDDTESELSWPERLQMAAAFFGAADSPSTGSFLGDLAQFGKDTTPGVAKVLAARDKRELAAKKRRIQSVKDFRDFVRTEKLDAREAAKLAVDVGRTQAETLKLLKEINSPDIETKVDNQTIAAAQAILDKANTKYDKTKLRKGELPEIGTADYQLAQIAATLKITPSQAYQRAIAANAINRDTATNKMTIDVEKAITGNTSRPVEKVTKAEGGKVVDNRPILRYPEDF